MEIARVVEGEKLYELDEEDAQQLCLAIQRDTSDFPDALSGHETLPDGSRIIVAGSLGGLTTSESRALVCEAVMQNVGSASPSGHAHSP